MLQLIDDETASRYYNEIDTATGDDLQTKMSALESWATDKKAKQHRQEWDQVSGVFTDFDNYSAAEGLDDFDEESRYQYANRQFIAHQTGGKFEDQMFVYPSKRDEVTDQMFGKTEVSEKEAFNLFKGAVESRKASEEALRELPGVLAQGVLKRAGEGKEFDEVDSWFAFSDWKERHADKLGAMPAGWETAMLDSAVKLHARTEALMADVAPESKRAMDVLMKFTRPEDAADLPEAGRADVETLAKDFAKLTPEQRDGIYATLSYAAEAGGAGLGKGFWEKVGEGVARGGVNIYDDAAMTAEDRQARQNISFFQDLLDKPQAEPDRMQTAESIQMQRDMAQDGLDKNKERLGELRVMREIRDLAQGRIDPIKTEMDGVLGSVVQGAYDFSQSAAYTGMAMIPYVGLPAVMGALANSNYLRMLDEYPDMDADAAYNLSLAIAGPQAVIERFQGGLLLGKLPYLNQAMKRLTDVRVPLPARLGLGYAGVVGAETVTELAQEAMPVVADQIASAVREDMPEFDSEKAWGEYREQAPKIFYSMLWGGLIGGGAVGIRELDRSGVFMRNVQELEMHGITGEAAQNIAAEQDPDAATTMFREAWDKRSPADIQAGISKRAAMLDAAQATQANPDLPTRRVEQAPDGTTTHIIEQNGQAVYRTSDPAAADMALINITRMMDRSRITGTTTGIVESLQFIDQVNQATNRGEDVQKLLLDGSPRTLLDDYEANPTEQNLDNLFATVRAFGQDISEPAELANFPVLASNQGALAEGIFKSVIRIQDGATGVEVMRDFSQDNLKRAIGEGRVTMDWVREQLNQVIPLIESDRLEGRSLRTETDTDVIESFSDVAVAYMNGRIRDEQVPAGFRGFLRRMAIVVKDIFRRAYRLKRAIADGKVDSNFESFLADSVGLNQQSRVDTARERVGGELTQGNFNYSIGSMAERIAATAVIDKDGKILSSPLKTHAQLMEESAFDLDGGEFPPTQNFGFVTTAGRFVLQKEAQQLAQQAKQVQGNQPISGEIVSGLEREGRLNPEVDPLDGSVSEINKILREVGDQMDQGLTLQNYATRDDLPEFQSSVVDDAADFADYLANDLAPQFPKEFANRIKSAAGNIQSQAVTTDTGATNYSIGMTVAPLRRDSLSELNKKEMQKRASSAKFIHLQQVIDDVAKAYGVKIESRQPVIGGWVEGGQISLEVPEAILFDTDDLDMAQEMAAIVGSSAPELQNAVMLWKDDDAGKDTVLEFQAKGADSALAIAKDLNNAGLNGFTYDTKTRKFSLVLAGVADEDISKVYDYISNQSASGNISSRGGTQTRAGSARFPSESDYRGYLQGARSRAGLLQQGQREALLDVVDRAERRVDRYASALKISEQAKKIQKKLKRPSTSALAIETELKGKQFDNIRQLGLYLDARFNKVFGKPSFEIGGQEGIDIASDAFVYDIIDGLAGDGSGMGWYDERVQETIRELSKLHPEFATDSNALAVYIGILATTSQGYTVVENFKQANKVYNEYKRTGRIPTDFKFAKSSDPINSNLAQIQGLIDEHGLDGYAEFMDQEVTGQALRDQFGKTPTGVTLKDTVRGNRVLGPKIGSFFNNLRGQFDTITMDLWYTRTMHRFLGETVVPLDSEKMQKAITKFREELKKDGVRTYGIDLTEALKDDEATVQAALTLFQRWARGDNDYTEKGYFKFPDGYKIEKAARGIFSIGGMKGAPQNKTHRQYFAKVVLEAKAKLAKLGMKLTEADMQAIIWYREKNLFARTGVANAAAKPADYLDAVMVARSGAQAQEDVDPADLEAEEADTNYSIASRSEIDRVNRALGGMNRGPDERLKVYERAREKFSLLQAWNRDELQAMQETGADDTTIRRSQILQGLGELDAILSILPPEVRGRVGGYTKLASIAPHDVFKDGVKVSEVSGMNGAIISAWMREGQNIGQAGKQVSLPPGYEAKENLATARADKAIADFFRDRIKKIDSEFEKVVAREYRSAILDLVKKSRPKAGDNNVRKSTLGAETQKLADMVQRATLMDEDAVAERMLQLEQTIATSENSADMVEEWGILNQFGDLKSRNSETLAQAYGWFKDQLQMGREAWRIKEESRIAENRERAKKTIEFISKATTVNRWKNKTFMNRVSDWANHALLDHASFEQFVTALLPPDVAADFSERLRKADTAAQKAEIDQREGILNALRQGAKAAGTTTSKAMVMLKTEVPSAVRYLDDRKVKNTKLTIEQAEKIVRGEIDRGDLTDTDVLNLSDELAALPADTRKENIVLKQVTFRGKEVRLPMTRGKAIQLLLSWNQPDVQDKMRREGWSEDSIADLRELTSDPVSQAMIAHAQDLYGKGASIMNPVYSRMFGMNMPQVKNYAPTRFLHSGDVKDIGLDGSPVATGTTPGFAKSRVTHSAKIASEDALSVMQQHVLMQAHWVNFAELAREYRSLITNPEIREAIKAKHGDGVLKIAEQWAEQMEQRGGNQAREAKWVSDLVGSAIGGQSVASLGFNLKTLAMQLDNSVRFALALNKKQIMAAMSSPDQLVEDIKTVFESDALQIRLKGGATAVTKYMFQRYGGRPGTAAKITEASMSTINWVDTATTSFSAAIVYRANLNEALEAGMPEALARETALDAAAAAIYRFAQPVSFGQKSNVENTNNIYGKAFFLFMSDPRLKTSIMADAVRGLVTGQGDKGAHIRRIIAIEAMALLSHFVASSYRDAFSDDEDEDIWSYGGWARAFLLAPLQGFFFLGTFSDLVLSHLLDAGWFTPTQNPLIRIGQQGVRALKNADDILAFDDPDALLKEWNNIARTIAVAPGGAMPAVLLNAVKPIFGAIENAENEE